MKRFTLFLVLQFVVSMGMVSVAQGWTMIWSDEFDYQGLPDPGKWVYDAGGGGWGNNELQYYTENRTENARVEDGKLIIEARKENYENSNYTSARLLTRGKGDWLYGRIEVRAKLPGGRGAWPAIWMLPTDWEYGGWPASGEIDIMEYVGYDPDVVHFTVHTDAYNHSIGTQVGRSTILDDPENNFYTYSIEWYPDRVEFFVDDAKYFTFNNEDKTFSEWPFDKAFHLILNIAIGGDWGGADGVDEALFPKMMEVDFVRVYKSPETVFIEGPELVAPNEHNVQYRLDEIEGWNYQWIVPGDVNIISGENSSSVIVDWGCSEGVLKCEVDGDGFSQVIEYPVGIEMSELAGPMFFDDNEEGLAFSLPEMHSSTYAWNLPAGVDIVQGEATHSIQANWGTQEGVVEVVVANECLDQETFSLNIYASGQYPYPDINQPHVIPGIINATQYDAGGSGVAYNDNTAENEGTGSRQNESVDTEFGDNGNPNVGWIEAGEWLEYTLEVEASSLYLVELRVASDVAQHGPVTFMVNGENRGEIQVQQTNGWDDFVSVQGEIALEEDDTVLRLNMGNGGFNLSDIEFTIDSSVTEEDPAFSVQVYPVPVVDVLYIEARQAVRSLEVVNLAGEIILSRSFGALLNHQQLSLSSVPRGIYLLKIMLENGSVVHRQIVK
jgi:beta-glucanase (GH16 family)